MKKALIVIVIIVITAMVTALLIPGKHTTINDHGDIWHVIEEDEFKIEWRHVNNSQDTMAVIHIHQGDSLFTWVGKPCNCY